MEYKIPIIRILIYIIFIELIILENIFLSDIIDMFFEMIIFSYFYLFCAVILEILFYKKPQKTIGTYQSK